MTLKQEVLEFITSECLCLRKNLCNLFIVSYIFRCWYVVDFIKKSFRYSISSFKKLCFFFIGRYKKLCMCPARIVGTLEIILPLNFYILCLALYNYEGMSITFFIILTFPYNNICSRSSWTSLRVWYFYLFSHLIKWVSIVVHDMAYIFLAYSFFWCEYEPLISQWRVYFIFFYLNLKHKSLSYSEYCMIIFIMAIVKSLAINLKSYIFVYIYIQTMRPDKNYTKKIEILRDFFRSGWVYQSFEAMGKLLGYANSAGVKRFFEKLVSEWVLAFENRVYVPTQKLTGYHLFESVRAWLPFTPETQPTSQMDLQKYLIEHPASTYFVKVKWDSMIEAGIQQGDIVILDRSLTPNNGDIVIASLDWDVTLKYFEKKWERLRLIPANPKYEPIVVSWPCEILGVVSGSVRKYR